MWEERDTGTHRQIHTATQENTQMEDKGTGTDRLRKPSSRHRFRFKQQTTEDGRHGV